MTTPALEGSAVFSACRRYRYLLTRHLGPNARTATFIMLNPSTADARTDDPTIRRCIGFARQWECGKLVVLNLFAYRATDPLDLKRAKDPVGSKNRAWFARTLERHRNDEGPVVCGWGVHGTYLNQDLSVMGWIAALSIKPLALGATREGYPRHPLYVPAAASLIAFGGRAGRLISRDQLPAKTHGPL